MNTRDDIVVVAARRTPQGALLGTLSALTAPQLGAAAIRAALGDAGPGVQAIDGVTMGCVLSAGLGQAPARQAALGAGIALATPALTINKMCGSGMQAVMLAADQLRAGSAGLLVAGGMESMSNAPYLLPQARQGLRMGHATLVDSLVHDGLWDAYNDYHMGITAENVAEKFSISREEQDRFALESHRRAAAAWREGRFAAEVVPVEVPGKKGAATLFDRDESIRPDVTLEGLAALKPAFKKDGTVTAGNAPGLNDAAAAVLLMSASRARSLGVTPMATVRAQATSGVEPKWVLMAPVTGVQKALARAGWPIESVDLFELNEAFAVQALAVTRELGLDGERVNVNGGAVAIGHPIGASGARVLVTLLHEMIRRDAHRGIAALCLGGGNSVALAVER